MRAARWAGCAVAMACALQPGAAQQESRLVEIEARLVRATPEQISEVFGISGSAGILGVLREEQVRGALEALRKTDAEFLDQPRTVVHSGHRASILGVSELRYPTQFDKDPKTGKQVPVGFESRNVGATLEYAPVVESDGRTISIESMASIVSFRGFIDYSDGKPGFDLLKDEGALDAVLRAPLKAGGIWQPVFSVSESSTTATVLSGETFVLGMFPPTFDESADGKKVPAPPPAGRRQLYLFTTARILPAEE